MASTQVNLYEAKTQLSSLVERAAAGEEIIIAKAGQPMAKLSAIAEAAGTDSEGPTIYREFGNNVLGITYIADDFDVPLPDEVLREFGFDIP